MTASFKLLHSGTPNSSQKWFFLLILQTAFKNRVKIPSACLAITFPRQTSSHFGISPSCSSLTMLETVQTLRVKNTLSYKRPRQLHSRLRMIIVSSEESDGQLVARRVKVMCPLWRVEDGETQGPQLHPAPSCRGEGSGQTLGRTDACRKTEPTKRRKVSN